MRETDGERRKRIPRELDDCEVRHQGRVTSRPTVPFDLPKSRLPSAFHPAPRQSCSLGSKRFGTDLSKLCGTTPISDPSPSLAVRFLLSSPPVSPPPSLLLPPLFSLSLRSAPRHYIEPSSLSILQRLFPFSGPADKSRPGCRIFPQASFFFIALASYVIDLYFNDLFSFYFRSMYNFCAKFSRLRLQLR